MRIVNNLDNRYKVLQEIVEKELSYAAHDLDHILRVYNLCMLLAGEEKDVDLEVLIPAALLHDIARREEDEDITGEIDHAVVGAEMAGRILHNLDYDPEIIIRIKDCIKAHRFRSGFTPDTIEAKILFDADKLDVIGAIGIARSFMLAGEHGEKMYNDISLDKYLQENVGPNGRIKDASKHTANLEFELKLKKIPERLFTDKAKEIAVKRIKYMESFFKTLEEEINGQKK
jgi:uncharacterized protein